MKKETIEKLFRRYIGIYDDVVFRTTGEHISENEINTVNDQVDQLFKEYEHVETLNDFTQFTKKIQEILKNTSESAGKLNKDQWEKSVNEICWRLNNDPFGLIQERLDYAAKHIQVDENNPNKFYIPADSDLEKIGKKYGIKYCYTYDPSTYVTPEELKKINDKKEEEQQKYFESEIQSIINHINEIPLQFCIETINKYFDKDLLLPLLFVKNDAKNKIIKYAISLPTIDKDLLIEEFKSLNDNVIIKISKIGFGENAKYFIENFIKTIPSREKILNYHFELWEEYIKYLNKKQQKELKKKIQIIKTYKDNLSDASVIRFQNVTNLLNDSSIYEAYKDLSDTFAIRFQNVTNLLNVKIEITLLINELETLKFKNGELNTYTEKYSNIINELFNTVKITELNQTTRDMVFYAIKPMIDEFNKQYKYKYQWLYAKSLLKKLIKIK